MSVTALDRLFLAAPPALGLCRPRSALDPFRTRAVDAEKEKEKEKETLARKRPHETIRVEHPQAALSLHLYGLQKNGWPRTLLTALRVDVEELLRPQRSVRSPSGAWASDSKVRLFFESLVVTNESTQKRPLSPGELAAQARPLLQLPTSVNDATTPVIRPRSGIRVDREIELVRARHKSSRRRSSAAKRMKRTKPDLERVEAAIVAAEANAQLSFELIERKAWHHASYESVPTASKVDNCQNEDTTQDDELARLRAENAEQKALIQHLLRENQRLMAQQQPEWTDMEDVSVTKKRRRSGSSVSTASSSSPPPSRRASLLLDDIDAYVDPAFDHLVSEIASELAELLSESDMGSPTHSEEDVVPWVF